MMHVYTGLHLLTSSVEVPRSGEGGGGGKREEEEVLIRTSSLGDVRPSGLIEGGSQTCYLP